MVWRSLNPNGSEEGPRGSDLFGRRFFGFSLFSFSSSFSLFPFLFSLFSFFFYHFFLVSFRLSGSRPVFLSFSFFFFDLIHDFLVPRLSLHVNSTLNHGEMVTQGMGTGGQGWDERAKKSSSRGQQVTSER